MRERLYKRGDVWWARINNRRVSTKCTDQRAAEAWYRREERRVHGASALSTDAPAHSIQDAIAHFVERGCLDLAEGTVRMYTEKGGQVIRLLGLVDVNALRRDDVAGYIVKRLEEGAARSTIKKELVTLRQTLKLALDREILLKDPVTLIPRFKVDVVARERYLTGEEFAKLLIATHVPKWRLWIALAVYTGGRRSEVGALRWEQVDLERGVVALHRTKRKKITQVPLHPSIVELLARVRPEGATGPIVGDWPNAVRDLAAACKRAGIPKATPNDLRRTTASWLKQKGIDSAAVAQLLGHSSTKMVDSVYGRIDVETLARAMHQLPGSASGECAAGVPNPGAVETLETLKTLDNPLKLVLEDRIELSTRGFSVLKSKPRKAVLRLKN